MKSNKVVGVRMKKKERRKKKERKRTRVLTEVVEMEGHEIGLLVAQEFQGERCAFVVGEILEERRSVGQDRFDWALDRVVEPFGFIEGC